MHPGYTAGSPWRNSRTPRPKTDLAHQRVRGSPRLRSRGGRHSTHTSLVEEGQRYRDAKSRAGTSVRRLDTLEGTRRSPRCPSVQTCSLFAGGFCGTVLSRPRSPSLPERPQTGPRLRLGPGVDTWTTTTTGYLAGQAAPWLTVRVTAYVGSRTRPRSHRLELTSALNGFREDLLLTAVCDSKAGPWTPRDDGLPVTGKRGPTGRRQ